MVSESKKRYLKKVMKPTGKGRYSGVKHRDLEYGRHHGEPRGKFEIDKGSPPRSKQLDRRNREYVESLRNRELMPKMPEDQLESYLNNVLGDLTQAADEGNVPMQREACSICNRPVKGYKPDAILTFIQVQNHEVCEDCRGRGFSSDLLGHMRD